MNFCAHASKRNTLIGTANNKAVEMPFAKNRTDDCTQTKNDANSQIFEAKKLIYKKKKIKNMCECREEAKEENC